MTARKKEQSKAEQKDKARERKQNASYGFETFTNSRKCPLIVCMLKLLFHSITLTVSNEYNTAFSLFFVMFFFFSCLLDCLGRGTTSPEGEKGEKQREEKEQAVGLQTAFDMCPG